LFQLLLSLVNKSILAAVFYTQFSLSMRKSRWWGLILPCITLLLVLYYLYVRTPLFASRFPGVTVQDVFFGIGVIRASTIHYTLLATVPTGIYLLCRFRKWKAQQSE